MDAEEPVPTLKTCPNASSLEVVAAKILAEITSDILKKAFKFTTLNIDYADVVSLMSKGPLSKGKKRSKFNTKFDIILCRNVLIYFNSHLQNRIFEFFHGHLFRNGSLILGAHESMLGTITAKYRKKGIAYIKK